MEIWKNYTSRFLNFNHWIFSLLPVIEGMIGALYLLRSFNPIRSKSTPLGRANRRI